MFDPEAIVLIDTDKIYHRIDDAYVIIDSSHFQKGMLRSYTICETASESRETNIRLLQKKFTECIFTTIPGRGELFIIRQCDVEKFDLGNTILKGVLLDRYERWLRQEIKMKGEELDPTMLEKAKEIWAEKLVHLQQLAKDKDRFQVTCQGGLACDLDP